MIELLEPRLSFTADAYYYITSGVLMIQMSNSRYLGVTITKPTINGVPTLRMDMIDYGDGSQHVTSYQIDGFPNGVHIFGTAGDDDISIQSDQDIPITVEGGDGNDSIRTLGDMNSATLNCGAGDDLLDVTSGCSENTVVVDGSGDDTIFVDSSNNEYPHNYGYFEHVQDFGGS